MWWGEKLRVKEQANARYILVAIAQSPTHEPRDKGGDRMSVARQLSVNPVVQSLFVWVFLSVNLDPGCALIGSSSPVSRTSSSSNYILFPPPVFCPFAFLLLFWLGSAAGHRSHKTITTPFQ